MSMFRRRLLGLGALLVILGIIVGLPVVLFAVGANPVGAGLPAWDDVTRALTSPDDGTLAVGLIKVVAWLSWAFLTVSLLVEMFSRLRGIRVPRMPGLRVPQAVARGLVGAAVVLFVAVPSVNVAHAAPAPDHAGVAIERAMEQQAAQQAQDATAALVGHAVGQAWQSAAAADLVEPGEAALAGAEQRPTTAVHTVQRGESLWSIAESRLGDGHRFHEIVELNADLLDGRPSFLQVGWELTVPVADDHGKAGQDEGSAARTVTVAQGDSLSQIAQDELGDANRYPEIFEASRDIEQPGGARLSDPEVIDVGWSVQIPGVEPLDAVPQEVGAPLVAPPAPPGPDLDQPATAPAVEAASESGAPAPSADVVHTADGVGALLAAGVLTLLAARRRTVQRLRRPGQRVSLPSADVAGTEALLRTTADPMSVETVDAALRGLASSCAATGTPLPSVRACRLSSVAFDLYLAEPAALPEPWTGHADGTIWRLDARRAQEGRPDRAAAAPFPALVTIGHDERDGHVLLNLEHLGGLSVTGDEQRVREVLGALALELALSPWADDLQVTVVGGFDRLEDGLRTGRIRSVRSVDQVLADLAERVDRDRRALTAGGVADVVQARAAGVAPDAWTPEIVIVLGALTDQQRHQLDALTSSQPRVAVAVVTTGGQAAGWNLDLSGGRTPEQAVLGPVGLELRAQRLPTERYGHLLHLLGSADPDALEGRPERELSLAEVETIAPVDEPADLDDVDDPDATHVAGTPAARHRADGDETRVRPAGPSVEQIGLRAPRVTVLGAVDLHDAGGTVAPADRPRLLEVAAYLVLHPGATGKVIARDVQPGQRSVSEAGLSTQLSKLRRWLGTAPDGSEFLPRHQSGSGHVLHPAVSSDVGDWDLLIGGQPAAAPTENLESAIGLVGGEPFAGARGRRYAWAEPVRQRLVAEIVDASYELARRRILEGRWRAAEQAVAVGLSVEPAQESLWRMRILAAHQSRDVDTESRAVHALLTATGQLDCDLEPETARLLAALQHPRDGFDRLMANSL
ncbi:LysM peptidoglycan-binding domain-containing protein [Isoptericola croceus]|uniref:LysM peptidoglycan-binding domain-containing protein n=1 Tax=Isoptericola croceus TaxID=3031406 RepID=UPI0023F7B1C2|nr:LysM peptidoglycan-binding domain-containing protein [Isoptericola croceus]